jgi:hypothetical protein
MRVLFRSGQTGKYVEQLLEWADNSKDAIDFTQIDQASTQPVRNDWPM